MNPLKRVHFAEPSKRQRIEPEAASRPQSASLAGRNIKPVPFDLVYREKWTGFYKFIYANDFIYEGNVFKGLPDGKGKTYCKFGAVHHEGGYAKGKFHGYGVERFCDSYSYFGNFHKDKFDGYGAIYNKDGELEYDGYWVNGLKYVGEVKNGKPNGYGTTYNMVGEKIYEGEWKDGVPHGFGTTYCYRGKVVPLFIGHFINGLKDGYGVQFWEHNGEIRAEGYWKENKWHGEMTYTNIDGTKTYHGFFENDTRVVNSDELEQERMTGYFKVLYPDGEIDEGFYFCGSKRKDNIHYYDFG